MYPTEKYTQWVPSRPRCLKTIYISSLPKGITWSGILLMHPGVQVILILPRVPGEGRGEMHKYIDIKGKKPRDPLLYICSSSVSTLLGCRTYHCASLTCHPIVSASEFSFSRAKMCLLWEQKH